MDFENDMNARYIAMRVLQNKENPKIGIPYDKAILSKTTTQAAINWWITQFESEEQA